MGHPNWPKTTSYLPESEHLSAFDRFSEISSHASAAEPALGAVEGAKQG
jgi:hypothetical protein